MNKLQETNPRIVLTPNHLEIIGNTIDLLALLSTVYSQSPEFNELVKESLFLYETMTKKKEKQA